MFCGKCGAKNADNAEICSECGAKLNGGETVKNDTPVTAAPNNKYRNIGIIAVAVIAVAVIGILITLFNGRSYKETVEQFIDAQFDADMEAILDLIPEELVDKALEAGGYSSDEFDKLVQEGNDALQNVMGSLKSYLGDNFDVSHKILSDEDITGDDLKDLKEDYASLDVDVSEAKEVKVELTIKVGEFKESQEIEISLIKVGRSWYLDIESLGSIF